MGRKATSGSYKLHPASRYRDVIRLVQGRRKTHPDAWEAQFKTDGKWGSPVGLKTEIEADAAMNAVEEYTRRQSGVVPIPRKPQHTLADAAQITIERLQFDFDEMLANDGPDKARNINLKIRSITRVLLPEFGKMAVKDISDEVMDKWLRNYKVTGRSKTAALRKPAKSTIANINMSYQEIMQDARSLGWITKAAVISIDQSNFAKGQRNPTFTADEMIKIRDHMTDGWIAKGHTEIVRQDRYLLRAQIALMCCTGLRAGLEVERITLGQIDFFSSDSAGKPSCCIYIRAKQGKYTIARDVWINKNEVWDAEALLRKLIFWLSENQTDAADKQNLNCYLFARPCDGRVPEFAVTFRHILDEIGLRIDPRTGDARVPYSCRHYYATENLMRGMKVAILVAQMGTSLRMIDEHYGHIIARLGSAELTGSGQMSNRRLRKMSELLKSATPDHTEAIDDE